MLKGLDGTEDTGLARHDFKLIMHRRDISLRIDLGCGHLARTGVGNGISWNVQLYSFRIDKRGIISLLTRGNENWWMYEEK